MSSSLFIAEYTLRLSGIGSSQSVGRVEVFHSGRWGTICKTGFTMHDANVICRQLGFESANSFNGQSIYGAGSGAIWLETPGCVGNEMKLAECRHRGLGNVSTTCTHVHDIGVECSNRDIASKFGPVCQQQKNQFSQFVKFNKSWLAKWLVVIYVFFQTDH